MKNDETIRNEWHKIDEVERTEQDKRTHECAVWEYIAESVAEICNVGKDEMLSESKRIHVSRPRWLFWYAYRYLTGETYRKIAYMNTYGLNGKSPFTSSAIAQGCRRMSSLIMNEKQWAQRWAFAKHVIKLRGEDEKMEDNNIVITVPNGLVGKIKITVKEK